MSFRRSLVGQNLICWNNLVTKLANLYLNDQQDVIRWSLTASGQFTVRSMYNAMINSDIMPQNRFLWKLKVPLKIKVFLWFLSKGVILTKYNLVKRNWHGNEKCCFCDNQEQYNIFSLTMRLLSLFGEQYNCLSASNNQQA